MGFLTFGSMPMQAQTGSDYQSEESVVYSGWCQYMDNLQNHSSLLNWRMILDAGLGLFGSTICLIEVVQPTPNLSRSVLSAVLCVAGIIDYYAYTLPQFRLLSYKIMMFRRIGADRLWVWPCSEK